MVKRKDWNGCVNGRSDGFDELSVAAITSDAGPSWSGPIRVIASDGRDYFVKCAETCPPGVEESLAIEHVVAQVGRLIGAPVVSTSLIRIPAALAGTEVRTNCYLRAGLAYASRALERADELGRPALIARSQDDNRRRHVGVYALYDWCYGFDQQWLYDLDHDRTIFSHDHGLYLPPNDGTVSSPSMTASVDVPHELPDDRSDLALEAVAEMVAALEKVDRASLIDVLCSVPASWPVSDTDLETLGWFLEHRAPAVAQRVRALSVKGMSQ